MPAKIPPDLIEFIRGKPGWVATASKDGVPNLSIKGSLRLLDENHLIFSDLFSLKTRKNLLENPQVAIMVYEESSRKGYSFKGVAELLDSGPLYTQTAELLKKTMPQLPAPRYVVKVRVDSIFDQSLGPNGGKQIV
jgi:uncharacterized protein